MAATCAVLAFNWVGTRGWTDGLILALLAVTVVGAIAFVMVEKRSKDALIHLALHVRLQRLLYPLRPGGAGHDRHRLRGHPFRPGHHQHPGRRGGGLPYRRPEGPY